MRVLIIAQYYPPDMGGGATRAYNAAIGLKKAGCSVTVISAAPHYPTGQITKRYRWKPLRIDYSEGIQILRSFVPPMKSAGLMKRIVLFLSFILSSLQGIFLARDIDVVYVSNPNVLGIFPGILYSAKNRCPLILNIDDLWPESVYDLGVSKASIIEKIGEPLANFAYHKANAVTPISPGYVKFITKKYHVDSEIIHVVRAGVNLGNFKQKQDRILENRIYHVLYVGALSPAYDFKQVLLAGKLLSQYPEIVITIQGAGEMGESLKQEIQRRKLTNTFVIEKIIGRGQVAQRLVESDILLLPLSGQRFIELGISSKLYEYQAASKPILCCSSGYPGYYVNESQSGIVIRPGDYTGLAEAIIRLRESPKLARTLGENGRRYVEENLSLNAIGRELVEVFTKYVQTLSTPSK